MPFTDDEDVSYGADFSAPLGPFDITQRPLYFQKQERIILSKKIWKTGFSRITLPKT
jgi:hypothetical protein